jgi:hypothetical protein
MQQAKRSLTLSLSFLSLSPYPLFPLQSPSNAKLPSALPTCIKSETVAVLRLRLRPLWVLRTHGELLFLHKCDGAQWLRVCGS